MDELLKKFKPNDEAAITFFVQNGFVVYEGMHDMRLIREAHDLMMDSYKKLKSLHAKKEIEFDMQGWTFAILSKFMKTELAEQLQTSETLVSTLEKYLGPDVCVLTNNCLYMNVPEDSDPVFQKPLHTDAWQGNSVYTLQVNTFFTDVDEKNGLTMCPGSHLLGFVPARNRTIDPLYNVKFKELNLTHLKAGDVVVFHPLIVHATSGKSQNIRIAIGDRYKSTETPFTSQERAVGHKTVSVGPLNNILRYIGNDYLSPFRIYGGKVLMDRRLRKLYKHSAYEKETKDYTKYI